MCLIPSSARPCVSVLVHSGGQHLATRNPLDYAAAYSSPLLSSSFCLPSPSSLLLSRPPFRLRMVPSGFLSFFLSFCRCSFALRKSFIEEEGRESVLLADCSLASRLPATDSIKERIPHLISDVLYIWPNDAPIFCLFTANSILLPPPPFNLPGFCGGAAIFGHGRDAAIRW